MKQMKPITRLTLALATTTIASAELLYHEPFAYPAADLTGNAGGTGWTSPWTDTGNPVTVTGTGLTYTDATGRMLNVSGQAANTADGGTATTISARDTGLRNEELFISVLIQPQGNSADFFGVSFYHEGLAIGDARFAIENSGGKNLRLSRRAAGTPAPPVFSPSYTTTVGSTVFCVIHLIPGGSAGATPLDRIDVYFNPFLTDIPLSPHASLAIDGLQFDRIRIAAQNGRPSIVDEIRIGTTWQAVTPHTTPADPDSDADGLTDSQEIALGLDPNVSNAPLIAAIRANAAWFSLHNPEEIADVSIGGLNIQQYNPQDIEYSFSLRDDSGTPTEDIFRQITPPPDRRFFRIKIATP